jgi:hypothetical protein
MGALVQVDENITRLWGLAVGFDVGGRYDLAEQEGKTRLRYVGVARYKTMLARLMEPVITPAAQKQLEQNLTTLKRLVEGAP